MIMEINELEFIGESLPKINNNFAELDQRADDLEGISSQYTGLSAFYATHSNNSAIAFKSYTSTIDTGGGTFNKLALLASAGVNLTKIIYPIPIYIYTVNSETNNNPTVDYKVKPTSGSGSYVSLIKSTIPSAKSGASVVDYAYNTITFTDLGYYDWNIVCNSLSATFKLVMAIKYLTS